MSTSNLNFSSDLTTIDNHKLGDCYRMGKLDIGQHAFEDCVIIGFAVEHGTGESWARLSRPYAYVSGNSVLLGSETFEVLVGWLNTRFVKVAGNYLL